MRCRAVYPGNLPVAEVEGFRRRGEMKVFKIGQTVRFTPGTHERSFAGVYTVTRRLPDERGEIQYRIKSTKDDHERVVREGQLTAT